MIEALRPNNTDSDIEVLADLICHLFVEQSNKDSASPLDKPMYRSSTSPRSRAEGDPVNEDRRCHICESE